jgi:2-polyprenyl-6-methoxyphenol hydroxylase-like FAD-dependent oxidoreductase
VVCHGLSGQRTVTAEWHFAWALNGHAVQDVWIAPHRRDRECGEPPVDWGTTIRFYDPGIDAWAIDLDRARERPRPAVHRPLGRRRDRPRRQLRRRQGLGLAQALVERGNGASELRLHAGGRVVAVRLFDVGLEDTAYPFLLFISQAETESVLNEYLAEQGVHVERGVELVAFEAGEEAVLSILRHGDVRTERLHARYLVGCDGAHSSVRRGAGIPFEGGAYPQTFVLGDLEVDGDLERDVGHAFLGVGGVLFFFPLARPASWRMLGIRPPGSEDDHERAEPAPR